MEENKNQGTGTITEEAPGENMVQITFLPEGKTVQYEHGKLPYEDHGKEESILDIALNYGVSARPRLRRQLRLHYLPRVDQRRRRKSIAHGRRRSRSTRHGRRFAVKLTSRLPGTDHEAG